MFALMMGLGILVIYCLGAVLYWRFVSTIPLLLFLIFFTTLWRVPESPLWLLSHRGTDDCREALQWLRYLMVSMIILLYNSCLYVELLRMSVRRSVRYRKPRSSRVTDSP